MKKLKNTKDVHLMTWETNPRKRNKSSIITFNTTVKDVKVGDKITALVKDDKYSTYTITKIQDKRPSSIDGMLYYTADTIWGYEC